tara:strand:+ start:12072 stop:12347 length:276 start_codon:yes stop_codon:yes gene_type:complete
MIDIDREMFYRYLTPEDKFMLQDEPPTSINPEPQGTKPCPFCGHFFPQLLESDDLCWISCIECDADGPPKPTVTEAQRAWNTRPYQGDGKN